METTFSWLDSDDRIFVTRAVVFSLPVAALVVCVFHYAVFMPLLLDSGAGCTAGGVGASGRPGLSTAASGDALLTPDDIPHLDEMTRLRFLTGRNRPNFFVDEKDIEADTVNVFQPLEGVPAAKQEGRAEGPGGVDAPGGPERTAGGAVDGASGRGPGMNEPRRPSRRRAMHFRGVMHIDGERYAIIERDGREMPWYVKEGELLKGSPYRLRSISGYDESVVLEARSADGKVTGTLTLASSADGIGYTATAN